MSAVVTIDIPELLYRKLVDEKGESNAPRWITEALVAGAVREGLISRGKGGEILGLSFTQREEFYAQRGVVYDYSDEELREQQRALELALMRGKERRSVNNDESGEK